MSRKGWIWIIIGGVVIIAWLTLAVILDIHWTVIAVVSITLAAPIWVFFGFLATASFIERAIWPRGVPDRDHRYEATFLWDSKNFGLAKSERTRVRDAALRFGHPLRVTRRRLVALLSLWLAPLVLWAFDTPPVLEWSICGVWLVFAMVIFTRLMKVSLIRWQSRGLVAIGRCPSCGYDLLNLPVADDGCSVCPECGAAWRVGSDDQSPDAGEPTV